MKLLVLLAFFTTQLCAQTQPKKQRGYFDNISYDSATATKVNFIADSTEGNPMYKSSISKLDYEVDSTLGLQKDYDFEFRLWTIFMSGNFNNVFIMTLKNKVWSAKYVDVQNRKFTANTVDEKQLGKLWTHLLLAHVLDHPPKSATENKLVNYSIDTTNLIYGGAISKMEITDGSLYHFELRSPNKKKEYYYNSPTAYFQKFSNVEELYYVINLIMLINKYIGKPVQVY